MKIPKTNVCCCCFSLRTGALILGWFGSSMYSVLFTKFLMKVLDFERDLQKRKEQHEKYKLIPDTQLERMMEHKTMYKAGLCALVFLFFVSLTFSSCLLAGIYKKNAAFVKIYLHGIIFSCIFGFLTQILLIIPLATPEASTPIVFSTIIINIFSLSKNHFFIETSNNWLKFEFL